MSETNTGTVICDFRDAYGDPIRGEVDLRFRNLKVQSLNRLVEAKLGDTPLEVRDVAAFPIGSWQVDINIERFRFKSVLINVPSNGKVNIQEDFFIKPSEADPSFPSVDEMRHLPRWKALADAIDPLKYEALKDQEKAGLFNLFAKMSHPSAERVFSDVIEIFKVKPARIYARVKPELWEKVQGLPQRFHEQPDGGSLHKFIDDWVRFDEHASFKTPDKMGNLQLTFAKNGQGHFAVDADLDDHQGLKHAFDVIKHKFSGDTNPYDIHDVLVKFHDIDPGYRLY